MSRGDPHGGATPLDRRPILVTGTHRSGTTWVGQTLAHAPAVGYLDEPFSVLHRPGVLPVAFRWWFPYVVGDRAAEVRPCLSRTLQFRYHYSAELASLRSAKDAARMVRDAMRFGLCRLRSARPLVKDPIAILSAPWLAHEFEMTVVVLVRHPAAFASSLKRMGWSHDFSHFLVQPHLVEDLVPMFEGLIVEYARHPPDIVDQASLLWNIFHTVIAAYRRSYPEWVFVRHEDLSRSPDSEFRRICSKISLPYTHAVAQYVAASSSSANPVEAGQGVAHLLYRDSSANVQSWRSRLTSEEIGRVRRATEEVARGFYDETEW